MNTTEMGIAIMNIIGLFLMGLILILGIIKYLSQNSFKPSFFILLIITAIYAAVYFWYKNYSKQEND